MFMRMLILVHARWLMLESKVAGSVLRNGIARWVRRGMEQTESQTPV